MSGQLELWGESPTRHNVFFAARPDSATATRVARIAEELARSRQMAATALPPERLHVSLFEVGQFAGQLPPTTIENAQAGAGTISIAPFTVVFDRVATFGGGRGKRALVLVGADGATGLFRLQEAVCIAMMKAGVKAAQSSKFTPHMTIMYADQKCDMPVAPISWTIDALFLIDSLVGQSTHQLLGQWALPEAAA